MKKKFTTFLTAIAFLLGAVFVGNAQSSSIKLNKTELENLYQIALGTQTDYVLAINEDGELVSVDATSLPTDVSLAHTFGVWKLNQKTRELILYINF
ncbi:MAG: hypothetical protein LUG96_12515 [Tannerellaceae bacterium]|nr:hypothetical protein [Tannerellaceae bacterium]